MSTDINLRLYRLGSIENWVSGVSPSERKMAVVLNKWVRSYLCSPHDQLGRDGPVCPFAKPSIDQDLFWISFTHEGNESLNWVQSNAEYIIKHFCSLAPRKGQDSILKTLAFIFQTPPLGPAYSDIDEIQHKLKDKFVSNGLMIGQFYPGCNQPGLWNKSFRPLDCPLSLLVVRSMVASDFPFLAGNRGNLDQIKSYLEKFCEGVPKNTREAIAEACKKYIQD